MAEYIRRGRYRYVNSGRVGTSDPFEREETHRSIRGLWQEGLTDNQIAIRVGVCSKTVMRFRHAHDLGPNFNVKGK